MNTINIRSEFHQIFSAIMSSDSLKEWIALGITSDRACCIVTGFFTSGSMPRRTTLYKIAKALNLPESAIGFKSTK